MNIYIIIYLIVSLVATIWIWNKYWAKEYNKAKNKGNVEDGMACIFMLSIFVFWPIMCIKNLINKIFNYE